MAVTTVRLQPEHRFRLLPPGVTPLWLEDLLKHCGPVEARQPGENCTATLLRRARPLLDPPDRMLLVWHFLEDLNCLWTAGGGCDGVDYARAAQALKVPVIRCREGIYAGEEGGLAMLEELECRGMVCDLGQTLFKVSWAERRWAFRRDVGALPHSQDVPVQTIELKGAQRRALRRFIAESLQQVIAEAGAGVPEGVVFALPSAMDKWGQPMGSSYIGMHMDTQLVTHALEMAGLPDIPHWLLNDAELAATSALFDERVIACGGKALVFTLGTAVGCALADPLAAALYFAEQVDDKRAHNT
jgi:hypothetical protein